MRPNARPEAEQIVIGTLLTDMDQMPAAALRLEADHFTENDCQIVYEHMVDLFQHSSLTRKALEHRLQERGEARPIGGIDRLGELERKAEDSGYDLAYFIGLLEDARFLRDIRPAAGELEGLLQSRSSVEIRRKKVEDKIADLLDATTAEEQGVFYGEDLRRVAKESYERGPVPVCPTGFMSLDEMIGGEPIGRVTVDAALTSMGKTTWEIQKAVQVARRLKKQGEGQVLYVSSELGEEAMARRMAGQMAGIDAEKIKRKELSADEEQAYTDAWIELGTLPITLDTTTTPTTRYFHSRVAQESAREPVELVIFDYLAYSGEVADNEPLRLGKAMRGCHQVAKRFDLAFTVVKQISRKGRDRGGAPHLQDMKWSSSVEEIAEMVKVLHSPWLLWNQQEGAPPEPDPNEYEVHVRKNTDGKVGIARQRFIREEVRFEDAREESYRGAGYVPQRDEHPAESRPF